MGKNRIAVFGGGCFWGVEEDFHHVNGVLKTEVGYMGGNLKKPTYEEVCGGETGHAEVVRVTYDESKVSYSALLEKFFEIHDPTQFNKQGPDVGEQYKSVIFYSTNEQKKQAEKKIIELEQSKKFDKKIATQIVALREFYIAEEYHQQYLHKRGMTSCNFTSRM